MNVETLAIIVSVVAIAISVYAIWKAAKFGTPITGELVQATLATSTTMAQELTEVSLTAVRASEQLWRSGKIERDARLDHAFTYVKQWFPDLNQTQILTAIESAVLIVNAVVDNMPKSKNP